MLHRRRGGLVSAGKYAFEGRDRIVGFFRLAMGRPSFLSSHRVHEPEIARTGYERVFEEILPRQGWQLTASLWGTGGRSRLEPPPAAKR